MKTHSRDAEVDEDMDRPGFVWAKCGKAIHETHITDNLHDVTCGSCRHIADVELMVAEAETAA